MRCRTCAGHMRETTTALPFKISERTIVIIKALPVIQCDACSEYLIADRIFARVEEMLSNADRAAELEIVAYAA